MAYSLETSSVKTIVPGAEVSGFADVVARQKISALSSEVPQLSAGEGIDISLVDDKTVITNNISAGENISLVYDQETNTYRIDAASQEISAYTLTGDDGIAVSTDHVNRQTIVSYTGTMGDLEVNNVVNSYSANGTWLTQQSLTNYYTKTDTSSKQEISAAIDYISSNAGLYTGIDPIQVNNTDHEISITGESLSAGPGITLFESGGYFIISSDASNPFPITGTNETTGFTANMDCSSMMLTTGASPAGGYVKQTTRGVQYEAYPSTDVSATWYNIINAANSKNITCSAVKLTTAASEIWFYTSALPNLNEITFIAPSYGPYETYSALIDDGDTTFVAEVDSGCCMKVVRSWNDDRNKNCWNGLVQESYFYIG